MTGDARLAAGQHRLDGVMYEVAQEKAGALRRMYDRLQGALQTLRAFDAGARDPEMAGAERARERALLVAEAGEALWYYVVQREACGLRDSEEVMRALDVPVEVQRRMGYRVRPAG